MNKKQWVAPSAQLVQFAANEYVAGCGTIFKFIGSLVSKFFMVESSNNWNSGSYRSDRFNSDRDSYAAMKDNDGWVNAGGNSYMNWNNFDWDDFVDDAADATDSYDQLVSTNKIGANGYYQSSSQIDTDDIIKGWYTNSNNLSGQSSWQKAYAFYDSETKNFYLTDSQNNINQVGKDWS